MDQEAFNNLVDSLVPLVKKCKMAVAKAAVDQKHKLISMKGDEEEISRLDEELKVLWRLDAHQTAKFAIKNTGTGKMSNIHKKTGAVSRVLLRIATHKIIQKHLLNVDHQDSHQVKRVSRDSSSEADYRASDSTSKVKAKRKISKRSDLEHKHSKLECKHSKLECKHSKLEQKHSKLKPKPQPNEKGIIIGNKKERQKTDVHKGNIGFGDSSSPRLKPIPKSKELVVKKFKLHSADDEAVESDTSFVFAEVTGVKSADKKQKRKKDSFFYDSDSDESHNSTNQDSNSAPCSSAKKQKKCDSVRGNRTDHHGHVGWGSDSQSQPKAKTGSYSAGSWSSTSNKSVRFTEEQHETFDDSPAGMKKGWDKSRGAGPTKTKTVTRDTPGENRGSSQIKLKTVGENRKERRANMRFESARNTQIQTNTKPRVDHQASGGKGQKGQTEELHKELHPTWLASIQRRQQEAQIKVFQGKKTVFND